MKNEGRNCWRFVFKMLEGRVGLDQFGMHTE